MGGALVVFGKPKNYNYYNALVGLFLEYKYTFVKLNDYDQESTKKINTLIEIYNLAYPAEQIEHLSTYHFNAGGHTILFGLRWHF